jgi:copper transport protein
VASPAAAHLDLVSTSPADGTVLKNIAAAITVTFNQKATPAGDGFTLLDARGAKVRSRADTSDDGLTWKVRPSQALQPGTRY